MNDEMIFSTSGAQQTYELGKRLGNILTPPCAVLLSGDLGAGKTVFAGGLVNGLGGHGHVTSPTFILMQVYSGRCEIVHMDLYRIADISEIFDAGLDEYFAGDGVCIVEWWQVAQPLVPERAVYVVISQGDDDNTRNITLTPCGGIKLEGMNC